MSSLLSIVLLVLLAVLTLFALRSLYAAIRAGSYGRAGMTAGLYVVAVAVAFLLVPAAEEEILPQTHGLESFLPKPLEAEYGFVGSSSCRECHSEEYASWHGSFHRQMTQPATPESVQASFDDVTLEFRGRTAKLERRDKEFWVNVVDPAWKRQQVFRNSQNGKPEYDEIHSDLVEPRADKQIVMTTGSHHKQYYWMFESASTKLVSFPWAYHIKDKRWVPIEFDFMMPTEQSHRQFDTAAYLNSQWSNNCIHCHSVGGQPRYWRMGDSMSYDAHVAELGIACEACHGPAQDHLLAEQEFQRSGVRPVDDDSHSQMINPLTCSPRQSAQICGQCHSFYYQFEEKFNDYLWSGNEYRAGDDLYESRHIIQYTEEPSEDWVKTLLKHTPSLMKDRFWSDGTVRVTGREYNGLVASSCYEHGALTCTSCHSMHHYEQTDDQLAAEMRGNQACLQCHSSYGDDIEQHTHHAANSSGSLCYNCHMPHTTYGLFKSVRSHRIDSPNISRGLQTGRPNACNLCHLDKTHAWSAQHMSEWYGSPEVEMDEDDQQVAASLLWLLRGDAVQRALAAWHMGWEPARQASGQDWQAPFLVHVLDDPYSAVRNVAGRTLKKLPEYAEWNYDFIAPSDQLSESKRNALEIWKQLDKPVSRTGSELLITPTGELEHEKIEQLSGQRDNRQIFIAE